MGIEVNGSLPELPLGPAASGAATLSLEPAQKLTIQSKPVAGPSKLLPARGGAQELSLCSSAFLAAVTPNAIELDPEGVEFEAPKSSLQPTFRLMRKAVNLLTTSLH
jgi:hypothetical protein